MRTGMSHEATGNSKTANVFGFALAAWLFALCFPVWRSSRRKFRGLDTYLELVLTRIT
jgi:hypothetical protein